MSGNRTYSLLTAARAAAAAVFLFCVAGRLDAAPGVEAAQVAPPPVREPIRQAAHTVPIPAEQAIRERQTNDGRSAQMTGGIPGAAQAAEQKTPLRSAEREGVLPDASQPGGARPVLTALASLAAVIGLFLMVIWGLRRSLPKVARRLPNEVVEVLGYATLGQRQQAQLIRLGNKLLLVGVNPSGAETLGEVTEPAEVDRLASLCRGPSTAGASVSFRNVLEQLRQRPAAGAATPEQAAASARPKSAREASRG
jgi:flagellar biogenesis protein FliO